MPIYVEPATDLSDKDIEDLHKIYADYPVTQAKQRLENYIANSNAADFQLVHARFNDRLLGALWLDTSDEQTRVHDICVRAITRRRGVGTRLLSVCQQKHSNLALASIPSEITEREAITQLAQKLRLKII